MYMYYPILLTCQMHADYTVIAHDILILEKGFRKMNRQ